MDERNYFGLLRRRERLTPTRRGWALFALGLAMFSTFTVRGIYPFLAVTEPVAGGFLVVEGWVSDAAMEAAVAEFRRHRYAMVYVTGGPVEHGAWMNRYKTFADAGRATLIELGLDPKEVQPIPSKQVRKDRTNAEAEAFGRWIRQSGAAVKTVHLISEGAHARRSRLLFQRALGGDVEVGVTSVPRGDFDPDHWWRSSAGVREVMGETVAYGYARLLFWLADE
jgi:hypothetical protein